jgi:uncharacterized membrane protein (DUF373 family)
MEITNSIEKFEKLVYAILMIMLVAVLLAAIVDLAWTLYTSLWVITPYLLEAHEMLVVLGAFLLVLIGVELLDTIKAYFRENAIHVEIVVLLAIIAVARKIILLDPTVTTTTMATNTTEAVTTITTMSGFDFGFEMMGMGVILVCLGTGYFLIKKAGLTFGPGGFKTKEE